MSRGKFRRLAYFYKEKLILTYLVQIIVLIVAKRNRGLLRICSYKYTQILSRKAASYLQIPIAHKLLNSLIPTKNPTVDMDQKLMNVLTISFLLVLAFTPVHSSDFFDVTSAKYGGKPNTDITKALLNAWTDACASPWESTIYVPKGTYGLKGAIFVGHCKAPIELQVEGTLQAPEDTGQVTSPDTWVGFRYLNRLTLSGGGTFDGRGALSWKQNDCNTNKNCKSRVVVSFYLNS